jgi:cilia- and flagella-associated protein 43
VPLEQR